MVGGGGGLLLLLLPLLQQQQKRQSGSNPAGLPPPSYGGLHARWGDCSCFFFFASLVLALVLYALSIADACMPVCMRYVFITISPFFYYCLNYRGVETRHVEDTGMSSVTDERTNGRTYVRMDVRT